MGRPIISIVIRTLNEASSLRDLLVAISTQEGINQNSLELIIVDNESTDGTQVIAEQFGAKVVNLPRREFTYPKSMNLGVEAAHGSIIVLTVGHALPKDANWLASILPYFENPKVAGVYGPVLPGKQCGFFERLLYWWGYLRAIVINPRVIRRTRTGVFGATNLALRRELWQWHPFNERYERGGEDTEWAKWALSKGYVIIREAGFTVRHSHGLSWHGLLAQIRYWKSLNQPGKFSRADLEYRKDIKP